MRVRLKRAADAGLGAATAAVVLAVLCVGIALPGLADRYGSKAQDLLLRWTPGEGRPCWVLDVVFAFAVVVCGVLGFRAWWRGEVGGLVGYAMCAVFLLGGWTFVPELLQAWVLTDRAPGWVR